MQYTRKIDREYQKLLLKGAVSSTKEDGTPDIKIDLANIQDANDYLVRELFWLKQAELDALTVQEFNEKLEEANKIREGDPLQ